MEIGRYDDQSAPGGLLGSSFSGPLVAAGNTRESEASHLSRQSTVRTMVRTSKKSLNPQQGQPGEISRKNYLLERGPVAVYAGLRNRLRCMCVAESRNGTLANRLCRRTPGKAGRGARQRSLEQRRHAPCRSTFDR